MCVYTIEIIYVNICTCTRITAIAYICILTVYTTHIEQVVFSLETREVDKRAFKGTIQSSSPLPYHPPSL